MHVALLLHYCVSRFEHYFVNHAKQLTFAFPEDAVSSKGALFWSAPKRFPKPLQFSSNDPSHISFITAASVLRAKLYGIPIPGWAMDPHKLANVVDRIQLPQFVPNLEFLELEVPLAFNTWEVPREILLRSTTYMMSKG